MDNNKKSALVDAAVAIVFFNRDDTLKEVFKRISQARPSELFLIQDGPRENNENDKADIEKCRAVCENIDWECKVHRNYAEKIWAAEHASQPVSIGFLKMSKAQ